MNNNCSSFVVGDIDRDKTEINDMFMKKEDISEFIEKYHYDIHDLLKGIIEKYPKDSIRNYFYSVCERLPFSNRKLGNQETVIKHIFEYTFKKYDIFSDLKSENNTSSYFVIFFDIIRETYNEFIKNKVEQCLVANKSLSELPDSVVRNKFKIELFIQMKESIKNKYICYMVNKVLKERTKKLKRNEVIKDEVIEEIFGSKKAIYPFKVKYPEWEELKSIESNILEIYYIILKDKIYNCLKERRTLSGLKNSVITDAEKFNTFFLFEKKIIEDYLDFFVDEYYYKNREIINFYSFISEILNIKKLGNIQFSDSLNRGSKVHYSYLKEYGDRKYEELGEYFIKTNKSQITLSNNNWSLYYRNGPRYLNREFNFESILSKEFRYEIKLYIMDQLSMSPIKNVNAMQLIVPCVNYLFETNPEVNCFSKIKSTHIAMLKHYLSKDYVSIHNKNIEPASMKKMFGKLGQVTEFLIKFSRNHKLLTPIPETNYFKNVVFNNIHNMYKRTEYIPEHVIEQLELHLDDLREQHRLMFEIFINAGIRLKEVVDLEENCIEDTEWEHIKILKYTPYKVGNTAKKHGRSEKNEIIITKELGEKIKYQMKVSEPLRKKYKKYKLKNIFLDGLEDQGQIRPNILSGKGFVKALNRIAVKHNIIGYDSEKWHFTSRQLRKTVVVNMIENGATKTEIAYVLGHYNVKTMEKYYAEVKEKRVAEMNNEFFKNKFKIAIGEECLEKFSEEDRKLLYIDFITDYRRVELGYCTKHYSEGECGKVSGMINCANCEKLCTGKQFLNEWIDLRNSQQKIIQDLIQFYTEHNILEQEYIEFKEYQKEVYYYNLYEDTINKILGY